MILSNDQTQEVLKPTYLDVEIDSLSNPGIRLKETIDFFAQNQIEDFVHQYLKKNQLLDFTKHQILTLTNNQTVELDPITQCIVKFGVFPGQELITPQGDSYVIGCSKEEKGDSSLLLYTNQGTDQNMYAYRGERSQLHVRVTKQDHSDGLHFNSLQKQEFHQKTLEEIESHQQAELNDEIKRALETPCNGVEELEIQKEIERSIKSDKQHLSKELEEFSQQVITEAISKMCDLDVQKQKIDPNAVLVPITENQRNGTNKIFPESLPAPFTNFLKNSPQRFTNDFEKNFPHFGKTDVVFVLKNKIKVFVHSSVLGNASDFFISLLSQSGFEKNVCIDKKGRKKFFLEHYEKTDFKSILGYLYSEKIYLSSKNIIKIEKLSNLLLLEKLQIICQEFYISILYFKNFFKFLTKIDNMSQELADLTKNILDQEKESLLLMDFEIIQENLCKASLDAFYIILPVFVSHQIFSLDQTLQIIDHWIHHHVQEITKEQAEELLLGIKGNQIPFEFLSNTMEIHSDYPKSFIGNIKANILFDSLKEAEKITYEQYLLLSKILKKMDTEFFIKNLNLICKKNLLEPRKSFFLLDQWVDHQKEDPMIEMKKKHLISLIPLDQMAAEDLVDHVEPKAYLKEGQLQSLLEQITEKAIEAIL